jgi:hypothetical protein
MNNFQKKLVLTAQPLPHGLQNFFYNFISLPMPTECKIFQPWNIRWIKKNGIKL